VTYDWIKEQILKHRETDEVSVFALP
jgi:hypothetical protein